MSPSRLIPLLLACLASAAEDARVTVSGEGLTVNGVASIHRGLFGVHNSPLSDAEAAELGVDSVRVINLAPGKPMTATGTTETTDAKGRRKITGLPKATDPLIECLYDRYQPALQLTSKDWREKLTAMGTAYGEQARSTGRKHVVEFWNEPYLNWATLPGVSYLAPYYQADKPEKGAPMRLKTTGEIVPELVWHREIWAAVNPANGAVDAVSTGRIPLDGKPGETVKLRFSPASITLDEGTEQEFPPFGKRVLRRIWIGKDTTQKHYWSGTYNRRLYIDMFQAFGTALKAANPDVELAAGWGLNLYNEGWDAWKLLYQPTIDAVHPLMDGLHEHHYGGDTRVVAASYEVAYAYTLARYGKRLRMWNTEAGGHLDPEQPGNVKSANEGSPLVRATAAMTYLLRDVIHLLAFCPDKAYARAAHHPHENGGDFVALRMLKPMRGRLLATTSSDHCLWSAASLDGDRLNLALFNDRREAQRVQVALRAPAGQRLIAARRLGHRIATRAKADGQDEEFLAYQETPLEIAAGAAWSGTVEVAGTSAAVLAFTLDGAAASAPVRHWTQHVSGDVLLSAAPGTPASTAIAIPATAVAAATGARLRLALSSPAAAACTLNGTAVPLPADGAWIIDLPIDRQLIAADNALVITATGDKPVLLASASLWLQHP